jgi:hypothetical protein
MSGRLNAIVIPGSRNLDPCEAFSIPAFLDANEQGSTLDNSPVKLMALLRPDPTFYPSPRLAMQAA